MSEIFKLVFYKNKSMKYYIELCLLFYLTTFSESLDANKEFIEILKKFSNNSKEYTLGALAVIQNELMMFIYPHYFYRSSQNDFKFNSNGEFKIELYADRLTDLSEHDDIMKNLCYDDRCLARSKVIFYKYTDSDYISRYCLAIDVDMNVANVYTIGKFKKLIDKAENIIFTTSINNYGDFSSPTPYSFALRYALLEVEYV